jgi:hypothetical protein
MTVIRKRMEKNAGFAEILLNEQIIKSSNSNNKNP